MKKLPLYLRLGFAIMGIDPYAKPPEEIPKPKQVNLHNPARAEPPQGETSQLAKWISTDAKLPEYYKPVIIYGMNPDTLEMEIMYNWSRVKDGRHDYYIHSVDDRCIYEVTHWMNITPPEDIPQQVNSHDKPKLPRK